jgi:DNA-directed RNA polymerase subunit RPC12/RpoP
VTIEFNCPKCGALIAFDSKHAAKRAKCLTCGERFLIPAESFQKPQTAEPEAERKEDPIPGFYHAVFVDCWRIFITPENATALVFVTAVVCFRFFLAQGCCVQYVAPFLIWGWLVGFYLNVICQTANDDDLLPEIYLGTFFTFLWHVIKPFVIFSYTLVVVELPFFITMSVAKSHGITLQQVWSGHTPLHLLLQFFQVGGLFLFPAAILTVAVGQDLLLLRPDYLLAPLWRAFRPYLTVVLLLVATCLLLMHTTQYTGASPVVTAMHLAGNLLVQVLAILSMRSIGLLYRHYSCYFKW